MSNFNQQQQEQEQEPVEQDSGQQGPDKKHPKICGFCSQKNSETIPLKKCALCEVVRYCNRRCQKNHWIIHKPYCRGELSYEP